VKPWAVRVRDHIGEWSARLHPLDWWPRYVYHFTDVQNAAGILQTGQLFSRSEARRRGLMRVDNASPAIIDQTHQAHLDYVRLYFRPKTPTQFRNEGIRPATQRELGAHCPVPIFFCFDALEVLCLDGTEFSDGNMASAHATHSGEQDFFFDIPFHLVFHNRAFTPLEHDAIVFHRHAEVLVPSRLPLEPQLKLVACRSSAERETLLQLLPPGVRRRWAPNIRLGLQGLFERRWTYVEEVVVVDDTVVFRFNPNTITPGPFKVEFNYEDDETRQSRSWTGQRQALNKELRIRVGHASSGTVTLRLDDALAYASWVPFQEIPF
jgi:hypothetical protein